MEHPDHRCFEVGGQNTFGVIKHKYDQTVCVFLSNGVEAKWLKTKREIRDKIQKKMRKIQIGKNKK